MRRTFGPILTTGVALTAAGVVVANPIVAPHPDLRIPSVSLSAGSDDAVGMLDQSFLDAIAPAPADSTNPFSILKDLISSLAADATYLGKNAIIDAFVAGVTAVSEPDLTATAVPYLAPPTTPPEVAMSVLPGLDIASLAPVSEAAVPAVTALTSAVGGSAIPAVHTLVSSLINDASYVGGEMISAAFAAGAVVVAEPALIGDTLVALVNGDFTRALESAVQAVIAPFGPPAMVLKAMLAVIEKHLIELGIIPATPGSDSEDTATGDADGTVQQPLDQSNVSTRRYAPVPLAAATGMPRPAAALGAADLRPDTGTPGGSPNRTAGSTDGTEAVRSRGALSAVHEAVQAAGDRIAAAANAAAGAAGKVGSRVRGEKPAAAGS